jgi:hypothetical protein
MRIFFAKQALKAITPKTVYQPKNKRRQAELPDDLAFWLDTPYSSKASVKALGARWCPAHCRWYAPKGKEEALAHWRDM